MAQEGGRLAVVHDVRDLGADEVVVDRGQVPTRLHGREVERHHLGPVREHGCHPVARGQTERAQAVHETVGGREQLPVGDLRPGRVDHGEAPRILLGQLPEPHGVGHGAQGRTRFSLRPRAPVRQAPSTTSATRRISSIPRAPITSMVTPASSHMGSSSADLRGRAHEGDVGGHGARDRGDGVLALALEEELLDLLRLALVAHAREHLLVEVHVLGAHPPDVEAQRRSHPVERRLHLVGHDHRAVRGDLEASRLVRVSRPREALLEPAAVHVGDLGRVVDRQPPVGHLGRQRDVPGPFRAQQNGHFAPKGVRDRLQRLAQPERARPPVRQGMVRPVVRHRRVTREHLSDDVDVLPRPCQGPVERSSVPTFDDLRSGHPQAEGEATPGQVVEGQGVHRARRRGAGRDLDDRRPEPDSLRPRPEPRQRAEGVAPPGLRGEDRVEAEALRLLHLGERVRGRPGAPVPKRQSELHRDLLVRIRTTLERVLARG